MSRSYGVVVVGGGSISGRHAEAIGLVRNAELVGFVGGKGAEARASDFGVTYAADLAAAMRADDVDIAVS